MLHTVQPPNFPPRKLYYVCSLQIAGNALLTFLNTPIFPNILVPLNQQFDFVNFKRENNYYGLLKIRINIWTVQRILVLVQFFPTFQ